jgi:hypothetical protein
MGKSEIQISKFSAFEPKPSAFTLISISRQTRDLLSMLGSETNPTSPLHIS